MTIDGQGGSIRRSLTVLLPTFFILYLFSRYSYLLFHTFAEFASSMIAAAAFIIAWNTRRHSQNEWIVFLGIAYAHVAVIDIFHTLSFSGMPIFVGYDYPAGQAWLIARSLEAVSLLIFSAFYGKPSPVPRPAVFLAFTIFTVGGLASIFVFRIFPPCFVEGQGQTPFKVIGETAIICVLLLASYFAFRSRGAMRSPVFGLTEASILLTAVSEVMFAGYVQVDDAMNLFGHFIKVASFYYFYEAIVRRGLEDPAELIFANLSASEAQLKRSNAAKDAFISILAHDLRNPISGIANLSRNLLDYPDESGPLADRRELEVIQSTARHALDLVTDLLDWAGYHDRKIDDKPETIDLREVAAEAIGLHSGSASDAGVALANEIPKGTMIHADPMRVNTIMRNLIGNGIKFTPGGGKVAVAVKDQDEEEDFISLEVADTGIGIHDDDLKMLFQIEKRFSRRGLRDERGTGFGLLLVKELAEQGGGSVAVRSRLGEGSVFSVALPRGSGRQGARATS